MIQMELIDKNNDEWNKLNSGLNDGNSSSNQKSTEQKGMKESDSLGNLFTTFNVNSIEMPSEDLQDGPPKELKTSRYNDEARRRSRYMKGASKTQNYEVKGEKHGD